MPALSPADCDRVRLQLDAINAAAALSPEGKQLVEQRVVAYRQHPGAAVAWAVAEEEIRKPIGL